MTYILCFILFFIGNFSFIHLAEDSSSKATFSDNIVNNEKKEEKEEINSDFKYYKILDDCNESFIINKIIINGCSEKNANIVRNVLNIRDGMLIRLRSTVISINLKNIFKSCNFIDDVQCFYEKCDDNSINIYFNIVESPLIVDYSLNNIKNERIENSLKNAIGKRYATPVYLRKIRNAIIQQAKEDGEEDTNNTVFDSSYYNNSQYLVHESPVGVSTGEYEIATKCNSNKKVYDNFSNNKSINNNKSFIKKAHKNIDKLTNKKLDNYINEDCQTVKINVIQINNSSSILDSINAISLLRDKVLRNIFNDKYFDVINIIRKYNVIKLEKFLNSRKDLAEEDLLKIVDDKKVLDEVVSIFKNKPLVKIEIVKKELKEDKFYIRKIFFEGNRNIKSNILLDKIKFFNDCMSKEISRSVNNLKIGKLKKIIDIFKFYTLINSSTKINDENINKQKADIIKYYNENGFINAKITKVEFIRIDDTKYFNVKYFINEGERFFINNIYFNGNATFNEGFLRSVLSLKKGDIFDVIGIKNRIFGTPEKMNVDGLKAFYYDEGFIECNINIRTSFYENKVDLFIDINEGNKIKVGIVKFYGNTNSESNYFRRYISLLPGDYFRLSDLALSQQSLARSDIIYNDSLTLFPVKNKYLDDVYDFQCDLREKFKLGTNFQFKGEYVKDGGYCCKCSPKVSFVFNIGNLNLNKLLHLKNKEVRWLGKRQDFSLEISSIPIKNEVLLKYRYSINSSLFIPDIIKNFGMASGFGFSTYFSNFDNEDESVFKNEEDKKEKQERIYNIYFYNKITISCLGDKVLLKIGIIDFNIKFNKYCRSCFNEGSVLKRSVDIPISFDVRYSTINRSFFVTHGVDLFFSLCFSNPILFFVKDVKEDLYNLDVLKYFRMIFYFAEYLPVFHKNVVLNLSLYCGFGYHFNKKPNSYFNLGEGPLATYLTEGVNNVTTFFIKCIDEDNNIPLKFSNMSKNKIAFKINTELRFKVINTPYFGIYLFLFFNAGNLYWKYDNVWKIFYKGIDKKSFLSYILSPIQYGGYGVGIMLNIPIIGSISLYLGLDKNTSSLAFGMNFRQDYEVIF